MSFGEIYTMAEITKWGGTISEMGINRRDLVSIRQTYNLVNYLADNGSVGGAAVDWQGDLGPDGEFIGRACDSRDREVGLVVLSDDMSAARLVSPEAWRTETTAKAERELAAAFAGGIMLDRIAWPTNVDVAEGQSGRMMVNLSTADRPIYLMSPTRKKDGKMAPAPVKDWRVITGPEWDRQTGDIPDSYEREHLRPSERPMQRTAVANWLPFDRMLSDEDGVLTYGLDEKVPRWAERDQSELVYRSKRLGFLVSSFEQSRTA